MEKLKKEYEKEIKEFVNQKRFIRRLWNIDEELSELLFMLVLCRKPEFILEIGTSNGYSTFWLSLAAERINAVVHTIEVDKKRYELACNNLRNRKNVILHQAKAEDILPEFDYSIDFLFIDAGKPGYIDYLKLVEDKLSDKAIIVADNIVSHPETTVSFREYLMNSPRYISTVLNYKSGLQIAYYKG